MVLEKEYLKKLAEGVYYDNPLEYVVDVFEDPGNPGESVRPDTWQEEVLSAIPFNNQVAIASGHGIGKALGINDLAATPSGYVRYGDLHPGMYVFGEDGRPAKITGVKDWGMVPFYRVTFDDGSYADVSSGHLWAVRGRQERRKGIPGYRVMETIDLLEAGVKRPNGKSMARQWEIPVQGAVQFERRETKVKPYTYGVMLGDGCIASSTVTSMDEEVIQGIHDDGYTTTFHQDNGQAVKFGVRGIRGLIPRLTSEHKYVEDEYKFNSIEVRLAVLQGLMDTDGTVGKKNGTATFTSTSKQLVEDVIWLVRSLGGKAMLQPAVKATFYRDADGNKIDGKPAYNCTVRLPQYDLFRVKRKLDRIVVAQDRYAVRWIESIEPIDDQHGICLEVEGGLYQTKDFQVTHNSALSSWIVHWFIATRDHPQIVVTANTASQLSGKTWRELKKWNDRAINKRHFRWTKTKFEHMADPDTWFAQAVPWSEHNSEAFAGTHESSGVLILFDESCFSADTEVLTDSGWKLFSELTGEELIMARKPDGSCGLEKPLAIHKSYRKGDMRMVRKRGASFMVTPNHRMIYQSQRGVEAIEEIDKIPMRYWIAPRHAGDLADETMDTFVLPGFSSARKSWDPISIKMHEWMYFLGWYASEGSTDKRKQKTGVVAHNCLRITNGDLSSLESLQDLVAGWGISSTIVSTSTTPQIVIHSRQLAEYLASHGFWSTNKRLPPEFRYASRRDLQYFIDSYIEGDGYWNGDRGIAYTSSKALADDVQELFWRAGYLSTITERVTSGSRIDGREIKASHGYVVSLAPNAGSLHVKDGDIKTVPYEGMVYCVTTPSGTLLTRREGRILWTGNSAIADTIYEVAAGAMTTEGSHWILFGNPTRNTGRFRECFPGGREQHRWWTKNVDSRTARMTDKSKLAEWVEDYGEDSDFVRVRIRGEFPRTSTSQFISSELVDDAMGRVLDTREFYQAVKVLGVDVAKGGESGDRHVIIRRQGRRAWEPKPFVEMDTMGLVAAVVDEYNAWQPHHICVDGTGVGTGVVHRLQELGYPVIDVMVGSQASDPVQYFNQRTELWGRMREWLRREAQLEPSQELKQELIAPEYDHTGKMQLRLEQKKYVKRRLGFSPDLADALALTFAADNLVTHVPTVLPVSKTRMRGWWSY